MVITMATNNTTKDVIKVLKTKYDQLSKGKASLLKLIDESELSESVFNSNAIENSTLTLKETERILTGDGKFPVMCLCVKCLKQRISRGCWNTSEVNPLSRSFPWM